MAGLAKTDQFVLGTATLMFGPMNKLFDLNPTDHSLGLVKDFRISYEPTYTELTQGVKNTIVHSAMTQAITRATAQVFEYTPGNLMFALGLDGAGKVSYTVETAVNGAVTGNGTVDELVVDSATGLAVDDYIIIDNNDDDDIVVRKIKTITGTTIEVTVPFATGTNLADNAVVKKVHGIKVGSKEDQPFLACKAVGELANGEPIVLLMPKVRVTKGFDISFTTQNYGNMPFEMTLYDLVSTDTYAAEFPEGPARIFLQ